MMRKCRAVSNLAALLLLVPAADGLLAQETHSTGHEFWTVDPSGALTTADWPVRGMLQMRITSTGDPVAPPAAGNGTAKEAAPLPQLTYQTHRAVTALGVIETKQGQHVTVSTQRSICFDAPRRAIRVLDIITSAEDVARPMTISFTTQWRAEAARKVSTPRLFSVANSASSRGALVSVMNDPKLPILMFIFGAENKGWKRTVTATTDSLQWAYAGALPAKQRVVLVHWLALTDNAQRDTLQQVRESLVNPSGMPADASFNDPLLKELINFPMETDMTPEGPPAHHLPLVEALSRALDIQRERHTDHMTMPGLPLVTGDFSAGNIQLDTGKEQIDLPLESIALLQGGAGIGRRARAFLRDGTVVSGRLAWVEGTFETPSLGTIHVTPESIDTLVLRISEELDAKEPFAALWQGHDGDVRRLTALPEGAAHLRWLGGRLDMPWEEILSLRQLPLPDLGQEVVLKDGSRIRGWFSHDGDPALADCAAYATTWAGLSAELEPKDAPSPPPGRRLRTVDDSTLAGDWAQEDLTLSGAAGAINVPVAEIERALVHANSREDKIILEVTTTNGATLRGAAMTDALKWRHGQQVLDVAWPLVSEIANSQAPSVKP